MKGNVREKFHVFLGVIITLTFLYGIYFFFKTISYMLFYEGMVKDTITEMIKQTALR